MTYNRQEDGSPESRDEQGRTLKTAFLLLGTLLPLGVQQDWSATHITASIFPLGLSPGCCWSQYSLLDLGPMQITQDGIPRYLTYLQLEWPFLFPQIISIHRFQKMVGRSFEGIPINPLYTSQGVRGFPRGTGLGVIHFVIVRASFFLTARASMCTTEPRLLGFTAPSWPKYKPSCQIPF